MRTLKKLLIGATISLVCTAGLQASEIGVSGNIGATSNYVWRGMTQANDKAALQGGVDVDYKGAYVGAWGSTLQSGDYELDLYGGYTNEFYGVGYDVGYVAYKYPKNDGLDFEEIYVGLSKEFYGVEVGASYYFGMDEATDYVEGSLGYDFGLVAASATYGSYDKIGDNWSVGLSKTFLEDSLELAVAYTEMKSDNGSGSDEEAALATVTYSF